MLEVTTYAIWLSFWEQFIVRFLSVKIYDVLDALIPLRRKLCWS